METRGFTFDPGWIIEERPELLVVHKPAGLLTHASADKSRQNLVDMLRQERPDLVGLTLVHRLDKDTSGLLLFTVGDDIRAGMAQRFEQRQVSKDYLCWVRGKRLASTFTVDVPLQDRSGRVRVGPGQAAHTEFALAQRKGPYCLLRAHPITGRKHQIRAHLAHLGLAIVGDSLFGGQAHPRLLLHAHRLQTTHPKTGQDLCWEAPPGSDFSPPE